MDRLAIAPSTPPPTTRAEDAQPLAPAGPRRIRSAHASTAILLALALALVAQTLAGGPLTAPARAGEDPSVEQARARLRQELAERFEVYDFEPRGAVPESRDMDADGWPDYWEQIKDEQHPPYLRPRIVEDPTRPGLRPGQAGHVLEVPFDGTAVAVQTRYPRLISPDHAYEVSLWARSKGLEHSIVRMTLIWLKVDPDGLEITLGRNTLRVPPGQVDWPQAPFLVRINDVPEGANRLRTRLEIKDDPRVAGADRHGRAWFDDIRVSARPKIRLPALFAEQGPLDLQIEYLGMEPPRQGLQAKRYYRTLRLTNFLGLPPLDPAGRPITPPRVPVVAGLQGSQIETLRLPLSEYGVYYLTVRLYDDGGARLAEAVRPIGLWPPMPEPQAVDPLRVAERGFGIRLVEPPPEALRRTGVLSNLIARTGVRYVKVEVWGNNSNPQKDAQYARELANEFRGLRAMGVRITGALSTAQGYLGGMPMRRAMRDNAERMKPHVMRAITYLDPLLDGWQWGADEDPSFSSGFAKEEVATLREALLSSSGSSRDVWPIALDAANLTLPAVEDFPTLSMRVPAEMPAMEMLRVLATLFPGRLEPINNPKDHIYAPRELRALAPPPFSDEERLAFAEVERHEPWVSVELLDPGSEMLRLANEQRLLGDLVRKAVLAQVLAPQRLFLGRISGEGKSLVQFDREGNPLPRPAFLAIRVLQDYLAGSRYLGSFVLRNQHGRFPNYVFEHRNGKEAVIALWYDGESTAAPVDLGGGYGLMNVDMQGNARPIPDNSRQVMVTRLPMLIAGMDLRLARTRMSIQILPDPPLAMRTLSQRQRIAITNFYTTPVSGRLRVRYAGNPSFIAEPTWRVDPISFPIRVGRSDEQGPRTAVFDFTVTPPANSTVNPGEDYGTKIVQVEASLDLQEPLTLRLIRETDMTGDLQVHLRKLNQPSDPFNDYILMNLRWFPSAEAGRQSGELTLIPYYQQVGGPPATRMRSVTVPRYEPGDNETPPIPIKFVIPRGTRIERTYIGFTQENGARFFRQEVTRLLESLPE